MIPIARHRLITILVAVALLLCGCGEFHPVWRDQKLPSGRAVKVAEFHLAWGAEHDERIPGNDSFDLEYVSSDPDAADEVREKEAKEVFELIRPIAELWEIKNASVAGFRTTTRKGKYDLYVFRRGTDGRWTSEHFARKVYAND
jgi:hypothetical protein